MKGIGYAGKIKNASNQKIKAPAQSTDKKTGKVQEGADLRTKSGK